MAGPRAKDSMRRMAPMSRVLLCKQVIVTALLGLALIAPTSCSSRSSQTPPIADAEPEVTLPELLGRDVRALPLPGGTCIVGRFSDGALLVKVISRGAPDSLEPGLYTYSAADGIIAPFYQTEGQYELEHEVVRAGTWAVWIEARAPLYQDWSIKARNHLTGEQLEVARARVSELAGSVPTAYIGRLRGHGSIVTWPCTAPDAAGAPASTLNLFDLSTRRHELLAVLERDGGARHGGVDVDGDFVAYDVGRPGPSAIEGRLMLLNRRDGSQLQLDSGPIRYLGGLNWPWVVWQAGDYTIKARNLASGREIAATGASRWLPTVWGNVVTWMQSADEPVRVLFLDHGREAALPWKSTGGAHLVDGLLCWWERDAADPKHVITRYMDLGSVHEE